MNLKSRPENLFVLCSEGNFAPVRVKTPLSNSMVAFTSEELASAMAAHRKGASTIVIPWSDFLSAHPELVGQPVHALLFETLAAIDMMSAAPGLFPYEDHLVVLPTSLS